MSNSIFKGLALTWKHLFSSHRKREMLPASDANYFKQMEGTNTIQYPHQKLPIPEVGRYQLDVEMDDCIVCDLCAKVCPVDCIDIESIKATEAIGQTSDGTTIVCPTECITMTNQYDRSVVNISELTYQFSDMTPEMALEKRREFDQQQAERQAAKLAAMQKKEGEQ